MSIYECGIGIWDLEPGKDPSVLRTSPRWGEPNEKIMLIV